jgi:hypothetical protein
MADITSRQETAGSRQKKEYRDPIVGAAFSRGSNDFNDFNGFNDLPLTAYYLTNRPIVAI